MRKMKGRRPVHLKTKLGLPDLEQAKTAVLASLRSPESQRSYRHAIDEFVSWYCSEPRLSFNKTVVTRYRIHLENTGHPAADRFALARASDSHVEALGLTWHDMSGKNNGQFAPFSWQNA